MHKKRALFLLFLEKIYKKYFTNRKKSATIKTEEEPPNKGQVETILGTK